jgi:hypothetical protein
VSVKVKPLRAGSSYVVGYRILSADGHSVTGKITFSLAAGATGVTAGATAGQAAQGSSAAAAEAAANGGAGMAAVWIVGALLLLAAGTAMALRRSPTALAAPSGTPDPIGTDTTPTAANAPDTTPADGGDTAAGPAGGRAAAASMSQSVEARGEGAGS